MNKYDEPLDLNFENSLSLIINQIQPNTVILEFGPAMGRMTKYLTQELNCEVYISEIDKEAYEYVMQYAKDGVLGDAENFEWFHQFSNIEFDYIIFADVLEHLVHPEKVLAKAAGLLKLDGRIMTSIPNIAYNGVIIDLIRNKFNYRDTGILDNTHLKFFTYESLENFFHEAGLMIEKEKIVYLNIEHSGFDNSYEMLPSEQANYLKKRDFAEAYQFVCTAIRRDYYLQNKEKLVIEKADGSDCAPLMATLYADTGSGFNEDEKLQQQYRIDKNNSFLLEFDLDKFQDIKQVRIDISNELCTLQNVKVNTPEELSVTNYGITIGAKSYFINEKTSVFVKNNNNQNLSHVILSGIIETPLLSEMEDLFSEKLQEIRNENTRLENVISHKQKEIQNAIDMYEDKLNIIQQMNTITSELQININEKNTIISNMERKLLIENAELDNKDRVIRRLQEECTIKDANINNLQGEISIKSDEIQRLQNEIDALHNSFCWKITKPIRILRLRK